MSARSKSSPKEVIRFAGKHSEGVHTEIILRHIFNTLSKPKNLRFGLIKEQDEVENPARGLSTIWDNI